MPIREITKDELEAELRRLFDEARATLQKLFTPMMQEARDYCERLKQEPHHVQIH